MLSLKCFGFEKEMDSPRKIDPNQHLKLGDRPEGFAASTDCILVVEGVELRVHSQVSCRHLQTSEKPLQRCGGTKLCVFHYDAQSRHASCGTRLSVLHPAACMMGSFLVMSASAAVLPCKTEVSCRRPHPIARVLVPQILSLRSSIFAELFGFTEVGYELFWLLFTLLASVEPWLPGC